MTAQADTMAMDVDSDHDASVKSDSSQLSYTSDFENLPATGPVGHAHIIDLGEYAQRAKEEGVVKLQDVIVTTLFNVAPDALRTFLDPKVNTFKAIFGKKDVQLVLWRKGVEVLVSDQTSSKEADPKYFSKVGTFENHTSMKVFRFEHIAGFLIGYDGSWHLKVTASNAYCSPKWPDVWAGKFEDWGGVTKMTVNCEEVGMGKEASCFAECILNTKYWEIKVDVKTT
jgi:hypothetical protein